MFLFSLSALTLVAVVTVMLLPALLSRRSVNQDDSAQQNIRIAQRRLGELDPAANPDDDATVAQTQADIEAALLDDLQEDPYQHPSSPKKPGMAWTVSIAAMIPLLSVGLYLLLGTPAALTTDSIISSSQNSTTENLATQKAPPVEVLVAQLEEKLAANPGDIEGWALAGKTYMSLGRFSEAERAYRTLNQLVGDDPHALTAWADAALMANDGVFSPQIRARVERALELRPEYDNALWIAALEAESRGGYDRALKYLERLLPLVDGRGVTDVNEFIMRMRGLTQSTASGLPAESETDSTAGPGALKVRVSIAPELAGQVRADQRIYIFAKAVNGPPMPLAVSRHRASELPVSVILDDSMAMIEGMKISAFEQVSVTARLSRSGNSGGPGAQPGDFESTAMIARTDDQTLLELVINRVVGAEQ